MIPPRTDLYLFAEKLFFGQAAVFAKLERRRRNHLLFIVLCAVAWGGAGMALGWVAGHLVPPEAPLSGMPLSVLLTLGPAMTGGWFAFTTFDRDYRRRCKWDLMPLLTGPLNLTYTPGGRDMKVGAIYDHLVLPPYTDHSNDDEFKGRYKSFRFAFSDFEIMPVYRLGRFDWRAFFAPLTLRGAVMRIELNKSFEHHTLVLPRFLAQGFLKRKLNDKFQDFGNVGLVYAPFHRKYTVLAEHQVEARTILDPAVIERFMKFEDLLGARWMEFSIRDRECVIYVQSFTNLFEFGSLFAPVNVLGLETVLRQIYGFISIIDLLELSPHTGLGGPQTKASF